MEERGTESCPLYKIVTFGEIGAGKSTLIIKFTSGIIGESNPTEEESYRKQIDVDGYPCMLDILDAVLVEERTSYHPRHIREGDAIILFYSISSRSSFHRLSFFRDEIESYKGERTLPVIVVATKNDLCDERQISVEEGRSFARSLDGTFFETSVKNEVNICDPFIESVRAIRRVKGIELPPISSSSSKKSSTCILS